MSPSTFAAFDFFECTLCDLKLASLHDAALLKLLIAGSGGGDTLALVSDEAITRLMIGLLLSEIVAFKFVMEIFSIESSGDGCLIFGLCFSSFGLNFSLSLCKLQLSSVLSSFTSLILILGMIDGGPSGLNFDVPGDGGREPEKRQLYLIRILLTRSWYIDNNQQKVGFIS